MADASLYFAEYNFALRVLSFYQRLVHACPPGEPDLGGNLLYAGELNEDGRAVVVASNIAGAASLCAVEDPDAQKQAIRDGIVDFVVTTLDEALRILKNEIRRRTTVAVCIAAPTPEIEAEMSERGVLPDLLRPKAVKNFVTDPEGVALVVWTVSSAPARWMPKLDALALQCAGEHAGSTRRWLRAAPRYLGRLAQATHLAHADRQFAAHFVERLKSLGDIEVPVRIQVGHTDGFEEHHLGPGPRPKTPNP